MRFALALGAACLCGIAMACSTFGDEPVGDDPDASDARAEAAEGDGGADGSVEPPCDPEPIPAPDAGFPDGGYPSGDPNCGQATRPDFLASKGFCGGCDYACETACVNGYCEAETRAEVGQVRLGNVRDRRLYYSVGLAPAVDAGPISHVKSVDVSGGLPDTHGTLARSAIYVPRAARGDVYGVVISPHEILRFRGPAPAPTPVVTSEQYFLGFEVDEENLFAVPTISNRPELMASDYDGRSTRVFARPGAEPGALAADAAAVYFLVRTSPGTNPARAEVLKSPRPRFDVVTPLHDAEGEFRALALDKNHVYWATAGREVWRRRKDASAPPEIVTRVPKKSPSDSREPYALAVSDRFAYLALTGGGATDIYRIRKCGGPPRRLVDDAMTVEPRIVLDGASFFFNEGPNIRRLLQ